MKMTKRRFPGGSVTHVPPENWRDINTMPTEMYDVYSYGILLWELLSERHPFDRGKYTLSTYQLVGWLSGRTSVSGRRTFPVLRSTYN